MMYLAYKGLKTWLVSVLGTYVRILLSIAWHDVHALEGTAGATIEVTPGADDDHEYMELVCV